MSDSLYTYSLVKYRDSGMNTYTYFWVSSEQRIVSPYFNSEEEAHAWINIPKFKPNKDPEVVNRWVTDCE